MTKQLRDSISAMLDGEANEMDLARVLKSAASEENDEQREIWRRYHLVSSVMRGEVDDTSHIDISRRVRESLAEEAVIHNRRFSGLLKPFASVAVAATVTVAILSGTQLYQVASGGGNANLQMAAVEGFNSSAPVTAAQFPGLSLRTSTGNQPAYTGPVNGAVYVDRHVNADALAEERLNAYLYRHVENSTLNSSSGLMPFARMPAAEEER
ncbi:MAG: sigma-E factor negative regulatory protein [Pseudomonadales bacterium]